MTYNTEAMREAIVQKLRLNYGCTEKQANEAEMMKACALVLRDIMAEREGAAGEVRQPPPGPALRPKPEK